MTVRSALNLAIFSAIALASTSASAVTNLVINGSFTSPATNSTTQVASIPGWTSTNGLKFEVGKSTIYGLTCYTAACHNLELNSTSFGSVSQTISGLTIGNAYELTWVYGGRTTAGLQQMNVSLNGVIIGSNTATNASPWRVGTFQFNAPTSSVVLNFASVNLGGKNSYGNELTGIALTSVPEPADWALLMIGFGAIGVASRRRKPILLS